MCSRILWNDNELAVVVARTMDWPESTEPILTSFPRGMQRDGGKVAGMDYVKENPLRWISRYGSLVSTIYGIGTADGVNECGLGAHMLFLEMTDFGPREPAKPGVHAGLWAQYLLDSAATVQEAITLMDTFQVVMMEARGHKSTTHLSIEDATGDSAIFEFVDGKLTVHHGRQHQLQTNEPPYADQIALLKQQDFSNPTDTTPVPGNVNPTDRFQRAAYFLALLPKPKSEREAVAAIVAIARNVSIPFGAPYEGFGVYNTEYRTVIDLTNLRYYFELATSPNVIWMDLAKLDLSASARVKVLNPDNTHLSGEVSGQFQVAAEIPF